MYTWKTWTKASALALGLGAIVALASAPAAQADSGPPQYKVDPSWPKQLPNNWLIGQVGGLAVDSHDHIWILQRPRALEDPNMVVAVDREAADLADEPVIGQLLGPGRVDLVLRRPRIGLRGRSGGERDDSAEPEGQGRCLGPCLPCVHVSLP